MDRKATAFDEHREVVEFVWHIGKGLMFRSQLIRFFELFGDRRPVIEDSIRQLIAAEVLETIRIGNSHVIKLRKFGIYTMTGKDPSHVSSVKVSTTKILRSGFLSEHLLQLLIKHPELCQKRLAGVHQLELRMTHFKPEKEAYLFLYFLTQWNKSRVEKGQNSFLSDYIKEEIRTLRIAHKFAHFGQNAEEAGQLRSQKKINLMVDPTSVNLNGLSARDIYLLFLRAKQGYEIYVDIVDLRSTMSPRQLKQKLQISYRYLQQIFDEHVGINFRILTPNPTKAHFFQSILPQIQLDFGNSIGQPHLEIEVVNLDIQSRLFSGTRLV